MILSETATLESGRYPGFGLEQEAFETFTKTRDVAVLLRDGTTIYIDIYLPIDAADAPALVAWSPYGKHGLKSLAIMPGADVEPGWVSEHVIWEGPDPAYWCPRGYAVVSPDPRGAWRSEGTLTFYSEQEAEDGYDLIEWVASQPWSNGKIGMLGVSYLAISQWLIASKRPPSLAAICPWEGVSDMYRESHYHGGIPETGFRKWWQPKSRFSLSPAEDVLQMNAAHPLIDAYWHSKTFDLAAIEVPAFVVASWGDHGMHTRGTIEGFQSIGSNEKWLEVHGRKKWRHFYDPRSVRKQAAFFDRFLKGDDTEVTQWPRATIEVRESNARSSVRTESAWPPEAVVAMPLYLNCADRSLQEAASPSNESHVDYDSEDPAARVRFDFTFSTDVELIGGAKLKLWVSTDRHDEMDLFVALQKLDARMQQVGFRYFSTFDEGPVALGWLRASHRALDPARSTPLRPVHPHTSRETLQPGQIVPVEVEIWPSGTLFRRGETLRLVVAGSDLYHFGTGAPELGHQAENRGAHRIWSGGPYDSHLLLPGMSAGITRRTAWL
jgi:predicted acyl esterase